MVPGNISVKSTEKHKMWRTTGLRFGADRRILRMYRNQNLFYSFHPPGFVVKYMHCQDSTEFVCRACIYLKEIEGGLEIWKILKITM